LAHVFIEYSQNLQQRLDVQRFVAAIHQAALQTGIFPIGGMRTRAYPTHAYCIADGHPDYAFVHLSIRVGHGRDLATRRKACEQIFEAACRELAELFRTIPLGVSVEMAELDPELSLKKNNLHEYVKTRQGKGAA